MSKPTSSSSSSQSQSQSPSPIVKLYKETFDKYEQIYGPQTPLAVLMQVGDFYELYGTDSFGDVPRICQILQIVCSRKNKHEKCISMTSPHFAGFPKHSYEKFVKILLQNNFHIVVVDQSDSKKTIREVSRVLSPGTYIDDVSYTPQGESTPTIACLYISDQNSGVGLSTLNISVGSSQSYELASQDYYEINRILESELPCELLVFYHHSYNEYSPQIKELKHSVPQFSSSACIKFQSLPRMHSNIHYQEEVLKEFYSQQQTGFLNVLEYIQLETKQNASISFVSLLHYVQQHDHSLLKSLEPPTVVSSKNKLILHDNSLYQLGIVTSNPEHKKGCLLYHIDHCHTAGGKRTLKHKMLNPLTSIDQLNRNYDFVSDFTHIQEDLTHYLKNMVDLERYVRKMCLFRISPNELVTLFYSLENVVELCSLFSPDQLRSLGLNEKTQKQFEDFMADFNATFHKDKLEKTFQIKNVMHNLFLDGLFSNIDTLQNKMDIIHNKVKDEAQVLSHCVKESAPSTKKDIQVYYDMGSSVGSGLDPQWHFHTTKKRAEIILKHKADVYMAKHQKSTTKLYADHLNIYKTQYDKLSQQLIVEVETKFHELVTKYCSCVNWNTLIEFVNLVDFYQCGAYVARHYGYVRPQFYDVCTDASKSTPNTPSKCTMKALRHAVIERLDNASEYVPNDVSLGCVSDHHELDQSNKGTQEDGMLLFGLNGGGKSSLMKSVGLCVVLAQMGFYVPCSSMTYIPFTHLYTRISGDDNVLKGQSSFQVEMQELRSILKLSDCNSLVLGDEICKGTEHDSALSLVASSLMMLSKRNKAKFIFATHLHDLNDLEEIKSLDNLGIYHLSVSCKNNKIIYDRTLMNGSGPSQYGLEVAHHLLHDPEMMELAHSIRTKNIKCSSYNSKVVVQKCALCGCKDNLDVHHIVFQETANVYGLVSSNNGGIKHKNDRSNLVVLCEKHHHEVHNNKIIIKGYQDTSEGVELDWEVVTHTQNKVPTKKEKWTSHEKQHIYSMKDRQLTQKIKIQRLEKEHNIKISIASMKRIWTEFENEIQ